MVKNARLMAEDKKSLDRQAVEHQPRITLNNCEGVEKWLGKAQKEKRKAYPQEKTWNDKRGSRRPKANRSSCAVQGRGGGRSKERRRKLNGSRRQRKIWRSGGQKPKKTLEKSRIPVRTTGKRSPDTQGEPQQNARENDHKVRAGPDTKKQDLLQHLKREGKEKRPPAAMAPGKGKKRG